MSNKPHPHAQLAIQYWSEAAVDAEAWRNWEYRLDTWWPCQGHPAFLPENEYRRRLRTIKIGDFDVPEPVREPLNNGQKYWLPGLTGSGDYITSQEQWDDCAYDRQWLQRGLIHLTEEAAVLHAKAALLSFTSRKEVES